MTLLSDLLDFICYRFFNFFLPHPAKPIRPVPIRSMVEGSGIGFVVILAYKPASLVAFSLVKNTLEIVWPPSVENPIKLKK